MIHCRPFSATEKIKVNLVSGRSGSSQGIFDWDAFLKFESFARLDLGETMSFFSIFVDFGFKLAIVGLSITFFPSQAEARVAAEEIGGVYRNRILEMRKHSKDWISIYDRNLTTLLTCRVEEVGSRTERLENLKKLREFLVEHGPRSEFKSYAYRFSSIVEISASALTQNYSTEGSDACAGSFEVMEQDINYRLTEINTQSAKLRNMSDQANAHQANWVSFSDDPFGPPRNKIAEECDLAYTSAIKGMTKIARQMDNMAELFEKELKLQKAKLITWKANLVKSKVACGGTSIGSQNFPETEPDGGCDRSLNSNGKPFNCHCGPGREYNGKTGKCFVR
mgnify:CR=1 FL=1